MGDIRSARDGRTCEKANYENVVEMLQLSRAPAFIVPGGDYSENDCGIDNLCWISYFLTFLSFGEDNEWNNCPNADEAWGHWHAVFERFDEKL